ncbi:MAG: tryptophan-rich sensory protein [Patescibacteria group bacterium]|nr:tryptophan-rich sensory protein [Patescibacteria group bacterium]MDE1945363.1 tryptophan-rich sensory protein [Patescibacteria group bacterium]MDE2057660.1 tryptophan-rich sensory protein [Patescibacteria group bacterium]
MNARSWLGLAAAVALSEGAGALGALSTAPAIASGWYAGLAKPLLMPPAWLFAPVWLALYALMGVALYLAWEARERSALACLLGLWLFFLQLGANALWSPIFFGARSPALALLDIGILWLLILATLALFARLSRPAAWLLAPYLAWVTFALYLNLAIVLLN